MINYYFGFIIYELSSQIDIIKQYPEISNFNEKGNN